jgi:hypothetical protein
MAKNSTVTIFEGQDPEDIVLQANAFIQGLPRTVGLSYYEVCTTDMEGSLFLAVRTNDGKDKKTITVTNKPKLWDTDASANHPILEIAGEVWYFGVKS